MVGIPRTPSPAILRKHPSLLKNDRLVILAGASVLGIIDDKIFFFNGFWSQSDLLPRYEGFDESYEGSGSPKMEILNFFGNKSE